MVRDVIGPLTEAMPMPVITGAALSAGSRREAVQPLLRMVSADRVAGEPDWRLGEAVDAPPLALGEASGDRQHARPRRTLGDGGSVPRQVSLALFDPARDWQMAVHQARVAGGLGPAESLAMPLAMEAGAAKAVAQRLARDAVRQPRRCDWPAGFAALAAPPGAAVTTVTGVHGRVAERRIEGAGVQLIIEAQRDAGMAAVAADGGRSLTAPDRLIGASKAWLFDLPWIDGLTNGGDGYSHMALAAAGEGPGWQQAAVSVAASAGAVPVAIGSVSAMTVLGEVVAIEGAGQPWLFDRAGAITVELLHESMLLANADDAALLGGANLAAAGSELFQFGHAEPVGGRQWRLTQLLRGRFGTEDAMALPATGRGFALVADPALLALPTALQVGGTVQVEGVADAGPLTLPVSASGRALHPLSPVALVARWQVDGAIAISWTRRSRMGAGWADHVDAPLDEREEAWVVTLTGPGYAGLVVERSTAELLIDAGTVNGWRTAGGYGASVMVEVVQRGAVGLSPPLIGQIGL